MNMNLKLDLKNIHFDSGATLRVLHRLQPIIIGTMLIGVFGYTAYTVNAALNVVPTAVPNVPVGVSFNKATLDSLKTLTNVPSTIAPSALVKSDPFGNN
jgi:hypothetical protein